MKIALLTYFAADNYGATLQAYATIKALEQQGYEVELVNYIIPEPPRSLVKKLILWPKHLKFQMFRQKWFKHLTREYKTLGELQIDPPKADCYLVGSDQTWNPFISKHLAKGFFLDFGTSDVLRTTYAASFGMATWEDSMWMTAEDAKRLLRQFDFISIRETSGLKLLEQFGVQSGTLVVDPVLLFERYDELTGNYPQSGELILYKLINTADYYERAKILGLKLNCPLRSIGSIRRIKGVRCAYPESIEGWISRIAGARYVITDSFHGTVISLLYCRQFVICAGDPKRITRIQSLLALLGLEHRILLDTDSVEKMVELLNEPIDYESVHEKLGKLRKKSFEYIDRIK